MPPAKGKPQLIKPNAKPQIVQSKAKPQIVQSKAKPQIVQSKILVKPGKYKAEQKSEPEGTSDGGRAKSNSGEIMSAFDPVRRFLILIGLIPFTSHHQPNGSYKLKFTVSLATIQFFILYFIVSFSLLTISLGFLLFMLNFFPSSETIPFFVEDVENPGSYVGGTKVWIKHIMKRNLVLFIIIWSCLVTSWATATVNFTNRFGYLQYVNFWCRAVDAMEMNVAPGTKGYFMTDHLITIILNAMFLIGFFGPTLGNDVDLNLIPDLADLLTTVMFAPFRRLEELAFGEKTSKDPEHWPFFKPSAAVLGKNNSEASYYWYKGPGLYLCVYSMSAFRGSILQFVFFNRLLVKACQIWNERLRNALALHTTMENVAKKEGKGTSEKREDTHRRLDLRSCLKDHLRIVQLFKMTNVLFSWTLLTYYAFQILGSTLLAYSLFGLRYEAPVYDYRIIGHLADDRESAAAISRSRLSSYREHYEWITAVQKGICLTTIGILLTIMVFLTTKTSAKAYQEGMGGFQILRRNFYLGNCDTKDERNFVHDLVVSFAPNNPLIVTADGYISLSRSLLPTLMGSVAGYFVACYTLKPDIGDFWDQVKQN